MIINYSYTRTHKCSRISSRAKARIYICMYVFRDENKAKNEINISTCMTLINCCFDLY